MNKETLFCITCKKPLQYLEVLENCSVSWPNQSWILFHCPYCKDQCHAWVKKGSISLGELDGAPGPCFISKCQVKVRGLKVECTDTGMRIEVAGLTCKFDAKA